MRICLTIWLALLAPFAALAECLPFDEALTLLASDSGEVPIFAGISGEGTVVIVAAPDGGTFTILGVTPDGKACGMGYGDGWSITPNALAPTGEDG